MLFVFFLYKRNFIVTSWILWSSMISEARAYCFYALRLGSCRHETFANISPSIKAKFPSFYPMAALLSRNSIFCFLYPSTKSVQQKRQKRLQAGSEQIINKDPLFKPKILLYFPINFPITLSYFSFQSNPSSNPSHPF